MTQRLAFRCPCVHSAVAAETTTRVVTQLAKARLLECAESLSVGPRDIACNDERVQHLVYCRPATRMILFMKRPKPPWRFRETLTRSAMDPRLAGEQKPRLGASLQDACDWGKTKA